MNNETIDYTLICNDKQEIGTVIMGVSVIKSEFSLWGRDFVSVVLYISQNFYRVYFTAFENIKVL